MEGHSHFLSTTERERDGRTHIAVALRRRHSLFGVRFWLSQRAIEGGYRRFVAYLQGTWAINVYMRLLGAKIGSWVTFRHCNVQTVPDMLHIGDGTHVGDMANMVVSFALDSCSVLVAPIEIGKQVRTWLLLLYNLIVVMIAIQNHAGSWLTCHHFVCTEPTFCFLPA
jgi:hypothetical protein